jgi:hypothetical protein
MRLLAHAAALLLVLPGAATAQDRAPFPDHWLTLDSLSDALALRAEERAQVSGAYADLNAVLQQAVQRREELKENFRTTGRVVLMSDGEREALKARLKTVAEEYEGRQADLDRRFAALRAQLTPAQQARFDALAKPRLVPEARPQGTPGP